MSKITFRADDDLVERLETAQGSKSEVMRKALREHLRGETDDHPRPGEQSVAERVDALVARRVDEVLAARLADRGRPPRDLNVSITVDGDERTVEAADAADVTEPRPDRADACVQCGEPVEADGVYCPNCGERTTPPVVCECGERLRPDWSFCPGCGRRTPAADVLDSA